MPDIGGGCDDTDDGDDDEEDVIVLDKVAPMTSQHRTGQTRSSVQGMVPMMVKIVNFQNG